MNFIASLVDVNSKIILICESEKSEEKITRLARVGF